MSNGKAGSKIWQVLEERLKLSSLSAMSYDVPKHANNLGYCLGGITLFGFILVAITGIYLAVFYHPIVTEANESVRLIASSTWGGFIRGLHYWGAVAVVISIILHMVRIYITGSYKKPREFNWFIGVGLLSVTIGLLFSGTVLRWDQEAFEAYMHNVEIGKIFGSLGMLFTGNTETFNLLTRMFTTHAILLPLILVLLFMGHAFLIKQHEISSLPWQKRTKETVPFTSHLKKLTTYGLSFWVILGILAAAFPPPLGPAAIWGIEVTKPPWFFLMFYPLEDLFGVKSIFYATTLIFVLLIAVPLVDRKEDRDPYKRKLMIAGLIIALTLYIALTLIGAFAAPKAHLNM